MKTLKQELELVKSERVRLEALNEERAELRAKLDQLESETQDSKNEAAAIARRIETEERRVAAAASAEQQARGRWNEPARSDTMDAESHARAMDKLRRRRAGMQKLLATLRDPQATYREEDGLRQLEGELKALERSQQAHARELTLLSKSVDATRVQLEAERKGGSIFGGPGGHGGGSALGVEIGAEEREAQEEEYVRRLTEMARTTAAAREKAVGTAQAAKDTWEAWFEVLSQCARLLDSRADAGSAGGVRVPEGSSTPAFRVLELVRELTVRQADLKKRAADGNAKEAQLGSRLKQFQSKISAQSLALRLDASRAAAIQKHLKQQQIQEHRSKQQQHDSYTAPAPGAAQETEETRLKLPVL